MAAHPALDLEVLYCHRASPKEQAAAGFGIEFDWDMSLLDGYAYRFLRNVSKTPSIDRFSGLDTPEVSQILSQRRYDAVLVSGWHYKSAWQAIRACWDQRIPLMVRSDSHLYTQRHRVKTLVKALPYRWFISKLDACLAVGQWSAEYFLHYGARLDRVFIVPHAVDHSFEEVAQCVLPQRTELRKRWQLKNTDTVFLFVGKFIEKKRPLDFVRAVQNASRSCAGVAGLMAGDGPLRERCERLVDEMRLPIRFTGFLNQSEISSAYIAADILVLPSDGGETWGLVVNEGMSCGLPCLVSDHVGCGPDLVLSGETGFVFPLGDVEALASRMADLAWRPRKIATMGANARQRVTRYSIPVAVDGVLRALSHVVSHA
jgi:glycosyltransferase involved in cell wall biosynthesis